ncbi:MAG: MauE/DoxX family redox-associated membrane protein [Opitutales bacterium]
MATRTRENPLIAAGRWLLAAIFASAGALKAWDPAATVQSLAHYHLLPAGLATWGGLYVPWLELAGAAALLTRGLRRGGWLLATLLSACFLVFTGSALLRGLDIDCGCFGTGPGVGHLPAMAALDAAMLLVSVLGLRAGIFGIRRSKS